ncbi:MAG: phosphate regulon transcriptional regulator PhoB [Gammaproteobacteria bacterium]
MIKNILIVDDEDAIRDMICFSLQRAGFGCLQARDVAEARIQIADKQPDLILLDWMMPGVSGVDYARMLRREESTRKLPIIMLTARDEEGDRIKGLETGADDYVTKPFSPRELIARINAVLRRSAPDTENDMIELSGIRFDTASHRVYVNEKNIEIGPTEYRLLYFFVTHPERVFSRNQILDGVWGGNVYIEERTVDVHIRRLRKILTVFGYDKCIQTVRNVGYRFSIQE